MLNRPTHTMTGDEFDALVALTDLLRAAAEERGRGMNVLDLMGTRCSLPKYWAALLDTGMRMLDAIDTAETARIAECKAEGAAAE